MIQHFESLSIDMPQPKFPLGTWVNDGDNWGIITGVSFYGFNQHPTWEHQDGWEYQVSYSSASPDWYLNDGAEWLTEDEVETMVCQLRATRESMVSQRAGRVLAEVCQTGVRA